MTALAYVIASAALLAARVAADRPAGWRLADAGRERRPRRCPLCGARLPLDHVANGDCPTCGER